MIHFMYLEKGIEEQCNPLLKHPSGLPHKPTPFAIACSECGGIACHTGTHWFEDFVEAKKGMSIFMNTKKCDHGKPVFVWGGE